MGKPGKMHCNTFLMHLHCKSWCQKTVTFIFCTMEFIINQNSASKNAFRYFSLGICILKTSARLLQKYCYKVLKKAIIDSQVLMGTTEC